MAAALFRAVQLSKAYAAPVLTDIDLTVNAGEVVALTGENGAGKSTLSRLIAGLATPDRGEMLLNGERFAPANRTAAERSGVRMVLQELSLIGTLSVAENLLLGEMPQRAGFIDRAALEARAHSKLALVGLESIDPTRAVAELGIGQQQLIEIARGLAGDTRLLILDEPTAMLTPNEVAELFAQIARLKARSVGLVYISHRLDELQRIADRVVVLRDGQLVCDRPTRELTHEDIVRAMVGRDLTREPRTSRRASRVEKLRCEHLSGTGVHDVSLTLHAGEIIGLAGLVGAGRTELLRLIFGADRKSAGDIFVDGAAVPTPIDSPADAVADGLGFLPEDRKSQGLLDGQSIRTNLLMSDWSAAARRGWISERDASGIVTKWMQRLRIRARDDTQDVNELSGGNQQKVLLGRWLQRNCQVLLLDEPTRGVDIGARTDIYAELDALAAEGKALLIVSSDLRELMLLCDRIAVMSAGRLVQVFDASTWTEETLLSAAFAGFTATRAQDSLRHAP